MQDSSDFQFPSRPTARFVRYLVTLEKERTGWSVRRNVSAELTTPSAPLQWLRDLLLLAQPPLLFKEGKTHLKNQKDPTHNVLRLTPTSRWEYGSCRK